MRTEKEEKKEQKMKKVKQKESIMQYTFFRISVIMLWSSVQYGLMNFIPLHST